MLILFLVFGSTFRFFDWGEKKRLFTIPAHCLGNGPEESLPPFSPSRTPPVPLPIPCHPSITRTGACVSTPPLLAMVPADFPPFVNSFFASILCASHSTFRQ